MKRKIFKSMCALSLAAVLLSTVFIALVMYGSFYQIMRENVRNEAVYIAAALNLAGEDYLNVQKNTTDLSRITLVSGDGLVLFDSAQEAGKMENHLDRPEILAALQSGHGEAMRFSKTLGVLTFYHAVRLDNGMVLRVSNTIGNVYAAVFDYVPYMLLISAAVILLSMLLARRQTWKIVAPINALNLEDPLSNEVYDELSPLLSRIAKQKSQIEKQLAKLREKQQEFFSVTENMSEGLILLDRKGNVLTLNKSAMQLLNIKAGDYPHRHILSVNRNLALKNAVERAMHGESCQQIISVDGRHYQLIASPVAGEEVAGTVLLFLDVTEKQAAEQIRCEFSANVSHELKTPLTSISGYAEIMKNGLAKQEDMPRFAERIYVEAQRLIAMVEDIIKLSRLDENQEQPAQEVVDLLALAKETGKRLSAKAAQKGVSLEFSGEPLVIKGTKQVLEEMIYNLCDNAIKYNRENGRVEVSVGKTPEGTVLSVSDTGIGIAREHQDRVFERFYQVDKSHSKETGGTGLGLSIVKHGAIHHRARVMLESELGKGTTVRVIFR